MCSHYQVVRDREKFRRRFGIEAPAEVPTLDIWPTLPASFIRRHAHADVGDEAVPAREALVGLFGLLPHWAKDSTLARHTYNARSETVAEKPSFRDAWKKGQHCIIPAEAFYEPDWRSGKAVPTRITLSDGEPMGIAGLWSSWHAPQGAVVHSFTMLTINADAHRLMNRFHKPGEEKRMVVILPVDRYDDWLQADPGHSRAFFEPYPAERMSATTPQAPSS